MGLLRFIINTLVQVYYTIIVKKLIRMLKMNPFEKLIK